MTTVPFHDKTSVAGLLMREVPDMRTPISAMIEIADRCNEVCVHCYQVQGQKGELPTEDWKKILDELSAMGVLFLTISGGEATLRRDFLELVTYARKLKFAVKLYTNGLRMTRDLANALSALAVHEVQISLYSHRAEVHDAVTRVPGSWQKTVDGARYLVEAGVHVLLKSVLMNANVADYEAYIDFVVGLGADYSLDPYLDPREDGDDSPTALRISDEAYREVMSNPKMSSTAQPTSAEVVAPKNAEHHICGACSGNIHIEANGEMRGCTQLQLPVGQATEGVSDAYYHHPEANFVRDLQWRDLPGCRECDLSGYCGRCFATALQEVGDALMPYPTACRRARRNFEMQHGKVTITATEESSSVETGPYVLTGSNSLRKKDVQRSERDVEVLKKHEWIQPSERLVQIRRPRSKKKSRKVVP